MTATVVGRAVVPSHQETMDHLWEDLAAIRQRIDRTRERLELLREQLKAQLAKSPNPPLMSVELVDGELVGVSARVGIMDVARARVVLDQVEALECYYSELICQAVRRDKEARS